MSADQPRKRTSADREPTSPRADESTPIAAATQTPTRDYDSISVRNDAPQEGTSGTLQKPSDPRRSSAERVAAGVEQRDSGGWHKFWERYGSVELENKGSVARDHLALERTFLAWLRTSLSFASIGIAITQLFRLNTSLSSHHHQNQNGHQNPPSIDTFSISPQARLRHLGKPLGATFIGISIVMLFIGFHRYFEAQHYIIRGKFPASRGSILVVSLIAGALIMSSLVVILVTAPSAFET